MQVVSFREGIAMFFVVFLMAHLTLPEKSRGRSRNLPQSSKNPTKTCQKDEVIQIIPPIMPASGKKKPSKKTKMTRTTNRTNNSYRFIPSKQIFDASLEGPIDFFWLVATQRFFCVHPYLGKMDPIWLIFFRWVVQPPTSFEFRWVLNVSYQKLDL